MKARNSFLTILVMLGLTILYTSCEKDEITDPPDDPIAKEELKVAEEDALADRLFSELTDITNEAMGGHLASLKGTMIDTIFMGPCVTVTIDTIAFPHTVTIDFGPVNCLCHDGKNRRGKILVSHTGPYLLPGTVVTTTFDNYFVNDHQLLGTKVVTNQGLNSANNPTWTIYVDGQVITPEGDTISWVGDRMREWVEGYTTPLMWHDNVFHITGSHSVVGTNGNTLFVQVKEALEVALDCYWVRKGKLEMQHSLLPLMLLDYGDGSCDDQATITINGVTYPITL